MSNVGTAIIIIIFLSLVVCAVLLSLPCITLATPLPDTGQTKCYDNSQEIACPNPGEDFYGQDAQYVINPQSYTKMDENGNNLPDEATEWVMVRDNVTGLIWEVKESQDNTTNYDNPHDADNTYSWSNSIGDGTGTEDFIDLLNSEQHGGYNDWRMPTVKELNFIVNSEKYDPSINAFYFPNTMPSYYWSYTTLAHSPFSWIVDFSVGRADIQYKSSHYSVRAVRGEQSGSFGNYRDNGDGTVTDTDTGLMWQQEMAPQSYTWQEALNYCESLLLAGYEDWRLPSVNELQSLVDYSRYDPAIDPVFVYHNIDRLYWSSTTDIRNSSGAGARVVDFCDGTSYSGGYKSSSDYFVRAVRGGQCGSFYDLDCDTIPDENDNCLHVANPNQEDTYPSLGNGIGDACECEADFMCDDDVDGSDASMFKYHFGRSISHYPCTTLDPCHGDFSCDGDVDGTDASLFKADFGRSEIQNRCPVCVAGVAWCTY